MGEHNKNLTDAQLVAIAVEWGFRQCEKGKNLELTLAEAMEVFGETEGCTNWTDPGDAIR